MKSFVTAAAALVTLTACDGANPFQQLATLDPVVEEDPDNPIADNGIPEALASNLNAVTYNPGTGSLTVDISALDRNDELVDEEAYTANANLTALAPGYQVYSYQDDGLDRMFVAIVAQSPDGSVQGAVVMDGGQFTKFFGGVNYVTDGTYTPGSGPNDTGLVSYAGFYAGMANLPADGAELIDNGGADGAITPDQPVQISGSIFLNADFGDNTINGSIYNASFQNLDPLFEAFLGTNEIPDVFLIPADITDAGTFFGDVENPEQENIGTYGGAFGGTEAPGVAGGIHLDGDWLPAIDNEEQFGVFVLTQCGQPGEAAICDDIPLNP